MKCKDCEHSEYIEIITKNGPVTCKKNGLAYGANHECHLSEEDRESESFSYDTGR